MADAAAIGRRDRLGRIDGAELTEPADSAAIVVSRRGTSAAATSESTPAARRATRRRNPAAIVRDTISSGRAITWSKPGGDPRQRARRHDRGVRDADAYAPSSRGPRRPPHQNVTRCPASALTAEAAANVRATARSYRARRRRDDPRQPARRLGTNCATWTPTPDLARISPAATSESAPRRCQVTAEASIVRAIAVLHYGRDAIS
jgi:hypothetical protein